MNDQPDPTRLLVLYKPPLSITAKSNHPSATKAVTSKPLTEEHWLGISRRVIFDEHSRTAGRKRKRKWSFDTRAAEDRHSILRSCEHFLTVDAAGTELVTVSKIIEQISVLGAPEVEKPPTRDEPTPLSFAVPANQTTKSLRIDDEDDLGNMGESLACYLDSIFPEYFSIPTQRPQHKTQNEAGTSYLPPVDHSLDGSLAHAGHSNNYTMQSFIAGRDSIGGFHHPPDWLPSPAMVGKPATDPTEHHSEANVHSVDSDHASTLTTDDGDSTQESGAQKDGETTRANNDPLIQHTSKHPQPITPTTKPFRFPIWQFNPPSTRPPSTPPARIHTLSSLSPNTRISILCLIRQINPVHEITMSKGAQSGQIVPMASISVGDDTVPFFPITFWRGQTKWVGEVVGGDVVLLKDIDIKSYRDKLSGTTSFRSSLKIVHRSVGDVPIDPAAMATMYEVGDKGRLMQLLTWAQQQGGVERFGKRRK